VPGRRRTAFADILRNKPDPVVEDLNRGEMEKFLEIRPYYSLRLWSQLEYPCLHTAFAD